MNQHGCGVGDPFPPATARAIVFARLVSLSKGYSAVRLELLAGLAQLLNHGVTPEIPRFGSVGASGDLTPLSYVAAVLAGEREARFDGDRLPADEALRRAGLSPFTFVPKEVLAIMNGTSAMVGVGTLATARLLRVVEVLERASALVCEVIFGRSQAFHPTAHRIKPHPGQIASAAAIRRHIDGSSAVDAVRGTNRIAQDPYSVRCAPQIIGAIRDALAWATTILETELNSASDNPLVDPDTGDILFAGNFFGGHVAFAMDLAKIAAASLVDLADREFALLLDTRFNEELPETLVTYTGNGVKALQITCTALAARAVQMSAPDSVLSRPTEVNNQDKVSMGLHAAQNAESLAEISEHAAATLLIALSNAAWVRRDVGLSPAALGLLQVVRSLSPPLQDDRRLDLDIVAITEWIRGGAVTEQGRLL